MKRKPLTRAHGTFDIYFSFQFPFRLKSSMQKKKVCGFHQLKSSYITNSPMISAHK